MNRTIFILLLVFTLSFFPGCNRDSGNGYSRNELLAIFGTAENTIREEGDYPKSLQLYLEFIRGAQGDPELEKELLTSYISVGVIYSTFKDDNNAADYFLRAYPLSRKLGVTEMSELALMNLAQSYLNQGKYKDADSLADTLIALDADKSRTLNFHHAIIKAEIALNNEEYANARRYIGQIDSIAISNQLSLYERSAAPELASRYYGKIQRPDSQLFSLNKAWSYISRIKDPQPKAEYARMLMEAHTEQGNTEEARKFQKIYLCLSDSLINLKQFLSVSANHQHSQINLKESEILNLHKAAEKHWAIIITITLLLLLTFIFLGIVIYQKRCLNTAYRILFNQSRQLMDIPAGNGRTDEKNDEISSQFKEESNVTDEKASSANDDNENQRLRLLFERIETEMTKSELYLNPDFGLSNLVSMMDSNVTYVSKAIKICTDMNVPTFINQYRIREACRRILDDKKYGHLTFSAIGESVGFNSQVSFNRAFKKVTGMSPSVYKQMATQSH